MNIKENYYKESYETGTHGKQSITILDLQKIYDTQVFNILKEGEADDYKKIEVGLGEEFRKRGFSVNLKELKRTIKQENKEPLTMTNVMQQADDYFEAKASY